MQMLSQQYATLVALNKRPPLHRALTTTPTMLEKYLGIEPPSDSIIDSLNRNYKCKSMSIVNMHVCNALALDNA